MESSCAPLFGCGWFETSVFLAETIPGPEVMLDWLTMHEEVEWMESLSWSWPEAMRGSSWGLLCRDRVAVSGVSLAVVSGL